MTSNCTNDDCQRIASACVKHKNAAIALKDRVEYQKKKLDEYRDLNMKLYDDVADLETDMKEKDDFVNRLVKKRNDLEIEVKFLMEKVALKNEDILRANFFNGKQKQLA